MVTIIEILFLIAGIWLLVSGMAPNRLLRILFGKGEYSLSTVNARLFGLFLASALVVGLALPDFEALYILVVAICAILIARMSRQSCQQKSNPDNNPGQ